MSPHSSCPGLIGGPSRHAYLEELTRRGRRPRGARSGRQRSLEIPHQDSTQQLSWPPQTLRGAEGALPLRALPRIPPRPPHAC
eukprot:scaffold297844_cov33-Tisochrysis_lutea.AAC.2